MTLGLTSSKGVHISFWDCSKIIYFIKNQSFTVQSSRQFTHHCMHCKYFQTVHSHWLCYVCHCNLAVRLSQTTIVYMIFTDIKEYNMRSIAIVGRNIYSQITVANVTLPKAVLNAVEIFSVYKCKLL